MISPILPFCPFGIVHISTKCVYFDSLSSEPATSSSTNGSHTAYPSTGTLFVCATLGDDLMNALRPSCRIPNLSFTLATLFTLGLCLVTAHGVQAQVSLAWANRYDAGASTFASPARIVSDSQGNTYVTGTVNLASPPHSEGLTIKYDPAGNILWKNWLGGSPHPVQAMNVALDPNLGNVYVLGYLDLIGPPNPADPEVTLGRYLSDGTASFPLYLPGVVALDFAVGPSGNVYVTGATNTSTANSQARTVGFNLNGGIVFLGSDPTPVAGFNTPNGIAIDAGENVYVSVGSTHFLPTIYKYDMTGKLLKSFTSDKFGTKNMIRVDAAGNIYIAACYAPGPVAAKFDTNGNELWIHNFQATRCFSDMKIDSHGAVILAETISPTSPNPTVGVVKLDANGIRQWENFFNCSEPGNFSQDLAIDSSDQIYLLAGTGTGSIAAAAIIKYTADGQQLFAQPSPVQTQGPIFPYSMVLGPDNRIIVTASAQNNPIGSSDILTFAYDQTTP